MIKCPHSIEERARRGADEPAGVDPVRRQTRRIQPPGTEVWVGPRETHPGLSATMQGRYSTYALGRWGTHEPGR